MSRPAIQRSLAALAAWLLLAGGAGDGATAPPSSLSGDGPDPRTAALALPDDSAESGAVRIAAERDGDPPGGGAPAVAGAVRSTPFPESLRLPCGPRAPAGPSARTLRLLTAPPHAPPLDRSR